MQNDLCLTTLEDYSQVYVYYKEKDGQWKKKFVFAPRDEGGEYLNLYHAAMGLSGNAYCSTSGEKLIKVNPETGKISKQFSWLPGIILTGCDFTGTEVSESLRNILHEHGAIIPDPI